MTQQQIRNRVNGRTKSPLRSREIDGVLYVDGAQVEEERADLLRRLNARDARARTGPNDATGDLAALRAEIARLTGVVDGLLVAARGHATATAGHAEVQAGYIDAIRRATLPSNAADITR
ncbi:MAG TPA: hypothetical protein VFQ85_17325 [Mycobacteriales bacterium]|jgi:hypothetical protein|nr:hypothetical protein [Mycobacteriales bacterium]